MGFFAELAASYIIFAFIFQALAVGFVCFDSRCMANRAAWAIVTLLTGPAGLLVYFFKGRK
jgi:hypothetical protein